jgi:hypothetical protein
MPDEPDWFSYAVIAGFAGLAGLVAYLIAKVIRRAEGRDRRRYVLAVLTLFGSPVAMAAVAWSVDRLAWRPVGGSLLGEWPFIANMFLATAGSASSAFVIPFRSPGSAASQSSAEQSPGS